MLLETLCNIPAKPQKWVWTGAIPEGQLTLLKGEPGAGKRMFAMEAIARSTRSPRGLSDLEASTVPEPGAEQDPSGKVWQSWPSSTARNLYEKGNLAKACEVGQLFLESIAQAEIEPATPGFSVL